ncbi:S-type pyocin domain-containing protein [Salmonella enterica]|nr:S-type pyocin domain-containing protein [Salmonella enterica]
MSGSSGYVPVFRPNAQSLGSNSQGEETVVVTVNAGRPGYGPGSLAADLGKIPRTPIQAESSAAIHATAKWSAAQLQKSRAEYAARQNALAAAQAKAKAARDALTERLKQESNARIHNTYVNPAIAGAHANNMAMQAEAARLGAARAAARARKQAEEAARQAEAELRAQQEAERQAAAALEAAAAKAEADARAAAEAAARAKAEADARAAAEAAARAKAEADARAAAEAAAREKAEADARAAAEAAARAKAEADARAAAEAAAREKAEADARAAAEAAARAKAEADVRAAAEAAARAKAEADARAAAEAAARAVTEKVLREPGVEHYSAATEAARKRTEEAFQAADAALKTSDPVELQRISDRLRSEGNTLFSYGDTWSYKGEGPGDDNWRFLTDRLSALETDFSQALLAHDAVNAERLTGELQTLNDELTQLHTSGVLYRSEGDIIRSYAVVIRQLSASLSSESRAVRAGLQGDTENAARQHQEAVSARQAAEAGADSVVSTIRAQAEAYADALKMARNESRAQADYNTRRLNYVKEKARIQDNLAALPPALHAGPVPDYTPEMMQKAEAAMAQPGVMALPFMPGMMTLSVAGEGMMPVTGEAGAITGNTLLRGVSELIKWAGSEEAALAATRFTTAGVLIAAFMPAEAGRGSDRVKGRDMEALFATQAGLLNGSIASLSPGADSVEMPVRATLTEENGHLALRLLSTGNGVVPATVRILDAVRDPETGLNRIIVPGRNGGRDREVLINPTEPDMRLFSPEESGDAAVPVSRPEPEHQAEDGQDDMVLFFPPRGEAPIPRTPVSDSLSVQPAVADMAAPLQPDMVPVTEEEALQDFIYWQVAPDGSGFMPVYVVMTPDITRSQEESGVRVEADTGLPFLTEDVFSRAAGMLLSTPSGDDVVMADFSTSDATADGPQALAVPATLLNGGQPVYGSEDDREAYLQVRASLIQAGGRHRLYLQKTDSGTDAIPFLQAVRNPATGRDEVRVPAMAGEPPLTVLINPVPVAQTGWHTGSPGGEVPPLVHTGGDVTAVPSLTVTTSPAADGVTFRDFIYWQPDAEGSGGQFIYVVLSVNPRNVPGRVSGHGQGNGDNWLQDADKGEGVPIPARIADRLRGREFSRFDAFRKALWTEIGKDPALLEQFNSNNKGNLKNGYSPFTPKLERVGGRERFELHHVIRVIDGGPVYDIDNLRVVTPKQHIEIHRGTK